jgi:hypothetical protein
MRPASNYLHTYPDHVSAYNYGSFSLSRTMSITNNDPSPCTRPLSLPLTANPLHSIPIRSPAFLCIKLLHLASRGVYLCRLHSSYPPALYFLASCILHSLAPYPSCARNVFSSVHSAAFLSVLSVPCIPRPVPTVMFRLLTFHMLSPAALYRIPGSGVLLC